MVLGWIQQMFKRVFSKKRDVKLGLYGPPNAGKTTLANRISMDWIGEEVGTVSSLPHETREIQTKEITIKKGRKELSFNLVDTPGIATRIDYEDFIKAGLPEREAKKRAREATKGVIDAIKWLDEMDAVIVVIDATKDPLNQVNITIIGNLQAQNIPVIIAANKIDLKRANITRVKDAFPAYEVIGISAKEGLGIEDLYEALFKLLK